MITVEGILDNLKGFIGSKINPYYIVSCFEDFEENGESKLLVGESYTKEIYDFVAFIDTERCTKFGLKLDENGILTSVVIHEP